MVSYVGLLTAIALADPSVNTAISNCEPARTAEIERLLAVELSGRPPQPESLLDITCSPARVALRVVTGKITRERELDPATSERTIALAAIELLDSVDELPAAQPERAQPKTASAWLLSAHGTAGVTHEPARFTYGGGLGADARILEAFPLLVLHGDVTALRTSRELSAGESTLTMLGIGGAVGLRTMDPQWRTFVAAGVRGGPVFVGGTSNDTGVTVKSATRAWFGPFVQARVERALSENVALLVGAEAGYVTRAIGLRVDGTSEASLNGMWIFGTLGVGFSL